MSGGLRGLAAFAAIALAVVLQVSVFSDFS